MDGESLNSALPREVVEEILTSKLASAVRVDSLDANTMLHIQARFKSDILSEGLVFRSEKRLFKPDSGVIE